MIVAKGVYALFLKFLQKNSPHTYSNEWGGGGGESQNCTGQKCTTYELVRRQFFNTIKV